ncbi:hypothetical protein [Chamaesiphon sp.]|uniref:hypothetical protein n=1 Tax=Chamaesiphon sp. TaxID=2814140 RepID=UPI0035930608
MNPENVQILITRYLDDGFEDTVYMAQIVNTLPFIDTSALICSLLKSSNYETFSITALFIRDVILYGNRNKDCYQFISKYPESSIVTTLEELVFSHNYFIRDEAIYTLGKTCSYNSKNKLRQAFDRFRDSDPLLLTKLLNEMQWLGVENSENCIEQMANSFSYLTRWAAVQYIKQSGNIFPSWVEILRRDNHKLVRTETEYEYRTTLEIIDKKVLSKVQQRQRSKEIKKIKPLILFQTVQGQFLSYLFHNGINGYSVTDLENYIDRVILS